MFAYGEASPQELKTALVGRRLSKGGLKQGHYLRLDHTSPACVKRFPYGAEDFMHWLQTRTSPWLLNFRAVIRIGRN